MVMNLLMAVTGPLAEPECRRALARGWVIVVRSLVAGAVALVILFLLWSSWLSTHLDPFYSLSSFEFQLSLSIAVHLMLTIALVMTPAVLAGSLAGERERGILHHLLVTALRPREIVIGRLAGKSSQVVMVLLSALPLLMLLAGWNDLSLLRLATLTLLLASVVGGGGGLAIGTSVVARRGRDALLGAYFLTLVLLLTPVVAHWTLRGAELDWLDTTSPYLSLSRLLWDEDPTPSLVTSGIWLSVGLLGTVLASWRLLPSCLASGDHVKRSGRRRRVPELGSKPMLWKELFFEHVGTLGRMGRWLELLIILPIGGGNLVLAAIAGWSLFVRGDATRSQWAIDGLSGLLRGTQLYLGWMIQWAVGLRAAVSIATERERGTWDAVLTTPLEPGEIVYAKLYGTLFALRWLVGTTILAWTLGMTVGAIGWGEYASWMVRNLSAGLLIAAIGLRFSLSLDTATKAMTWTIALWLGSYVMVALFALTLICLGMLACLTVWGLWLRMGMIAPNTPPVFLMSFPMAWTLTTNAVTFLIAFLIIIDTRLRFDRIAGRMAQGAVAVSVDGWLHEHSLRPVLLNGRPRKPVKPTMLLVEATLSDDGESDEV